ncbi:MAG: hypothetical protein ACTHOR_03535 [Devosia sp.]
MQFTEIAGLLAASMCARFGKMVAVVDESLRRAIQMAVSTWYLVVESMGKWWVDCEGKPFGPFDELSEATDGAIRLAEVFGDVHKKLQVMVPDGRGHFEVAWESVAGDDVEDPDADDAAVGGESLDPKPQLM